MSSPAAILTLSALLLACSKKPATAPGDETDRPGDGATTDSDLATGEPVDDTTPPTDSGGTTGDPGPPLALAGAPPTNLLVISIDTFQRDRMGRYAGTGDTPFLDGIFAASLVLEDHASCSDWTFPSVLCALGGGDLVDLGYVPWAAGNRDPVPTDLPFLAGFASQNGFTSGLVSANGYLGPGNGSGQGYDRVEIIDKEPAEEALAPALAQLDEMLATGQPWLLHVHFMDPHLPYDPPAAYLEGIEELGPLNRDLGSAMTSDSLHESWSSLPEWVQVILKPHLDFRYAAEYRYLDDQIRALFEAIEARGALEDTLLLVFSDHGEQLDEHNGLGHPLSMYGEEVEAVAALRAPGLAPRAWTEPTTHADLLPTVAALMGWTLEAETVTGLPVGEADPLRPRYAEDYREEETLQAVISGHRKVIYRWTGDWEYYELDADPGEQNDLSAAADYADLQALARDQAARIFEYYPQGPEPQ